MAKKIALVTDTTAYIPPEWIEKFNITVVPLVVIWSGEELLDNVDITPTTFYERLQSAAEMPTTSQPTPAAFKAAYEKLVAEDYDILSIHISSLLSGTINSAVQAKDMLPGATIEIVDSLSTSMELGWHVYMAAQAIAKGASLEECKRIAEQAREHSGIFFVVDTLEFLHRGGRIGGAQRFIGTALNFKPILEVKDGVIEALERVRTSKKAQARVIDIVEERIAGRSPVRLAAFHANAYEAAKQLLAEASQRLNPVDTAITDVSPAIGTHAGPGTVGLCFLAGME